MVRRSELQRGEFLGIWANSDDDVTAVSAAGAIFHWDGQSWFMTDVSTYGSLNAVFGISADNIWVVGAGGTVLKKYSVAAWASEESGTALDLYGVWGKLGYATVLWIVGNGIVLHWEGSPAGLVNRTPAGIVPK